MDVKVLEAAGDVLEVGETKVPHIRGYPHCPLVSGQLYGERPQAQEGTGDSSKYKVTSTSCDSCAKNTFRIRLIAWPDREVLR